MFVGLNMFPINIMPINISPTEIVKSVKTTYEKIMEMKSHFDKNYHCIGRIYTYIEKKDISMVINQLENNEDPIISDALIKLNDALTHVYNEISQYKSKYHIRCIDYSGLIEELDKRLSILNIRLELHKFNKLDDCLSQQMKHE